MTTKLAKRDEEIRTAALRISEVWFVPAKDHRFKPRDGTVMHAAWKSNKLTARHAKAWFLLVTDSDRAFGKSGSVTSRYGESTGARNPGEFRVPVAHENDSLRRLNALSAKLIPEQRRVLELLLEDDLDHGGTLSAEILGKLKIGYNNEDQARASGFTVIACVLDCVADHYQI